MSGDRRFRAIQPLRVARPVSAALRFYWRSACNFLLVLLILVGASGCVGAPEIRPRPLLAAEQAEDARSRMVGRWEGMLTIGDLKKPVWLLFDEETLQASMGSEITPARAWLPTVVASEVLVLVVVHDQNLKQSVLRFEGPDQFRLDELYDVVFRRVTAASSADATSNP